MRKKSLKRILSILLVTALFVTGCGSANTPGNSEKESQTESEKASSTTSESNVDQEKGKEYWQMLGEVSDTSELPDWKGEKLEVKIWTAGGTDIVLGNIPETNVTFKEFERVTGVVFNVEESYGNGGDNIDAMLPRIIASKDYPTIVYGWDVNAQLRELYDNGYLADLTEYYDNGDLWGVEYWMPREVDKEGLMYGNCRTEDGSYYLIPSGGAINTALYDYYGYSVDEYDVQYYSTYGKTPNTPASVSSGIAIWVRDDVLKAVRPSAMTAAEIEEIYMEKGSFTKEEIFDVGLETPEDFYQLLRDIKEEIASGDYVGLDGKPIEGTFGPHTETDNWDWLAKLGACVFNPRANVDYFTTAVLDKDASTPLLQKSWEVDVWVDFMRNLNALVNEDIISQTSLVDNSATFTEKNANAHYAVTYGNSARSILPTSETLEGVVDWGYRPVYLSALPSELYGGFKSIGDRTYGIGIFKDALSEEQLDQLVHAISYLCSPVGTKNFAWGPESAGLFTEDADGNRSFTDPDLEANILYKKDNEAAYKYGIVKGTCTTQTLYTQGLTICDLGRSLLEARYCSLDSMERSKVDAIKYYNPGTLEGYTPNENAVFVNQDPQIYSFGTQNVEAISDWWAARPGFEQQLTKVIVAPVEEFDDELAELDEYSESVGLTDEALKEYNQKYIEVNKDRLDAAGIVY